MNSLFCSRRRCQLAELSLDHFQRLCDSSLSLLRTSVTSANHDDSSVSLSVAQTHIQNSAHTSSSPSARFHQPSLQPPSRYPPSPPPPRTNLVQEAGELLANAASRWACEDIELSSSVDLCNFEVPVIALLDEVHRLRLQLSKQHARVVSAYAEGIKKFTAEKRLGGAT